jgi:hypothetical protein
MLPAIPPGAKMIDLEFVLQLGVSNRNVALACYKNGAPHAVASAHHAQNTQSKGATVSGIAPLPATFWTLIGGVTSCYGHCRFSWKAGDDIVYGNGHIFGNDNAGVPVDVTSSMYCSGLAGGSLTGIGVAADDGLVLTSGSYARIYSVW